MYQNLENDIKQLINKESKIESCGLVVEKNGSYKIFPCQNELKNKNHFAIAPRDYLKASLFGEIRGVFHTHVESLYQFSFHDKINSLNHQLDFILYHVPADKFYYLNHKEIKEKEQYLNKNFEYGKNDCYTLVKEYYNKELNIGMPEFFDYEPYFTKWTAKKEQFKTFYEFYGFQFNTNINELKKHDIILFNFYKQKFPPHFAIFLGNGFILHLPRGGFSQINVLTEMMAAKFGGFLRHKTQCY